MTVKYFLSTDSGAPTLSGTIGSLIGVLDACLVNGYGSKTSLGWTKPFSGTNLAAYKQTSGSEFYCRVADTGAQSATAAGFETMSDINTGTNRFPTTGQLSSGVYLYKSSSANSNARGWLLVGDEKRFYLFVAWLAPTIDGSTSYGQTLAFGDITSFKTGDAYNCMIEGAIGADPGLNFFGELGNTLSYAGTAKYMARSFTQIGGSVMVSKHTDNAKSNSTTNMANSGVAYPDPVSGGMLLGATYIAERTAVVRGIQTGIWVPLHHLPGNPGDTFSGTGNLSGKTFMLVDVAHGSSRGRCAVEISDTWG